VNVNSRLFASLQVAVEHAEGSDEWIASAPWLENPIKDKDPNEALRKALDARPKSASRS